MATITIHDAPASLRARWEDFNERDTMIVTGDYFRSLEALVVVVRKAVAHLAHNAGRMDEDSAYAATCALLMRLDAPGGQLAEALTRIDVIATGNATGPEGE